MRVCSVARMTQAGRAHPSGCSLKKRKLQSALIPSSQRSIFSQFGTIEIDREIYKQCLFEAMQVPARFPS